LLRNGEHFKGVDQEPEIATMPAWGWAFVGSCLAIPVLTLGGCSRQGLGAPRPVGPWREVPPSNRAKASSNASR
jgi:hypothetical protein